MFFHEASTQPGSSGSSIVLEKEKDFNLDHVMPLSRGGLNDPTNWRPTHKTCNAEKGSLTYEEWLLYQELLKKKYGHIK